MLFQLLEHHLWPLHLQTAASGLKLQCASNRELIKNPKSFTLCPCCSAVASPVTFGQKQLPQPEGARQTRSCMASSTQKHEPGKQQEERLDPVPLHSRWDSCVSVSRVEEPPRQEVSVNERGVSLLHALPAFASAASNTAVFARYLEDAESASVGCESPSKKIYTRWLLGRDVFRSAWWACMKVWWLAGKHLPCSLFIA